MMVIPIDILVRAEIHEICHCIEREIELPKDNRDEDSKCIRMHKRDH